MRDVRRLTDSRFPLVLWTVLDLEFLVIRQFDFKADRLGGVLDIELRGDGCRVTGLNLTVSADVTSTRLLTVLERRYGEDSVITLGTIVGHFGGERRFGAGHLQLDELHMSVIDAVCVVAFQHTALGRRVFDRLHLGLLAGLLHGLGVRTGRGRRTIGG